MDDQRLLHLVNFFNDDVSKSVIEAEIRDRREQMFQGMIADGLPITPADEFLIPHLATEYVLQERGFPPGSYLEYAASIVGVPEFQEPTNGSRVQ